MNETQYSLWRHDTSPRDGEKYFRRRTPISKRYKRANLLSLFKRVAETRRVRLIPWERETELPIESILPAEPPGNWLPEWRTDFGARQQKTRSSGSRRGRATLP